MDEGETEDNRQDSETSISTTIAKGIETGESHYFQCSCQRFENIASDADVSNYLMSCVKTYIVKLKYPFNLNDVKFV